MNIYRETRLEERRVNSVERKKKKKKNIYICIYIYVYIYLFIYFRERKVGCVGHVSLILVLWFAIFVFLLILTRN